MAAKSMSAARRTPLIAAIPKMLFPFLVILPGLIAIALPPQPSAIAGMAQRKSEIVVATVDSEGLIPPKVDPDRRVPYSTPTAKPVLDYDLAIPNMLLHYFPTGILGLGLDGAAGQLHVRHGRQRDGVQYRVDL